MARESNHTNLQRLTDGAVRSARWRALRIVPLAALALAALAAACKKTPYIETVKQTPYLGLPQNIDHIFSLDMNRLRQRAFVKEGIDKLRQDPATKAQFEKFTKGIGIEPLQDIDSVVIGTRGKFGAAASLGASINNAVFIARGRFADPGPKLDKLRNVLGEEYLITPPPFRESAHNGTEIKRFSMEAKSQYDEKITYSLNFGFPSDDMMIFSGSSALLGETLDAIAGQTPGLGKDKAWLSMLARPNIGAIFWGTGNFTQDISASSIPDLSLVNVRQYYCSLDVSARVECVVGLVCNSIESAVTLNDQLKKVQQGAPQLSAFLALLGPETAKLPGRLSILAKGDTVELVLSLTDADSTALKEEWRRGFGGQAVRTAPAAPKAGPPAAPVAPAPAAAPKAPAK